MLDKEGKVRPLEECKEQGFASKTSKQINTNTLMITFAKCRRSSRSGYGDEHLYGGRRKGFSPMDRQTGTPLGFDIALTDACQCSRPKSRSPVAQTSRSGACTQVLWAEEGAPQQPLCRASVGNHSRTR